MAAPRRHTVAAYVACGLIWGTTWYAIRRCIGAGGYPTFTSAAIRFFLAAIVLGAAYGLGFARPAPRGARQIGAIVGCGLLSAASYGLIYLAEQSISGGLACVLYGTFPLFTALFATLGGIERVPRRALAGALVAFAGIGVVFGDRLGTSRAQAVGIVLVLVSVMVSALYTTILKHVAGNVNPLATTGIFLATAALPLAAVRRDRRSETHLVAAARTDGGALVPRGRRVGAGVRGVLLLDQARHADDGIDARPGRADRRARRRCDRRT